MSRKLFSFSVTAEDKLSVQLMKLRDVLGKDVSKPLLQEQARLVIKDTINADNRLAILHKLVAWREAPTGKNFGHRAVDVRNQAVDLWVSHAAPSMFELILKLRNDRWRKLVEWTLQTGNLVRLNAAIHKRKKNWRMTTVGHFTPDLHFRNLNKRSGKTKFSGTAIILDSDIAARKRHIVSRQANVGLKHAGFIPAAKVLNLRLKKYVTRHAGAAGAISENFAYGEGTITITNSSSNDYKMRDRVKRGMEIRARKIGKVVERLIAGEAANLGLLSKRKGITLAQFKAMRTTSLDDKER